MAGIEAAGKAKGAILVARDHFPGDSAGHFKCPAKILISHRVEIQLTHFSEQVF